MPFYTCKLPLLGYISAAFNKEFLFRTKVIIALQTTLKLPGIMPLIKAKAQADSMDEIKPVKGNINDLDPKRREHIEELKQRMVTEIMDYAIILLDADGTIMDWNKGAEKIKGYKPEEIIGQNFRIFYLPQDREAKLPEKLLEQARKEGRAKHIGRRVRKDGTIFWGSILITAIHNEAGQVIGFTKLTKELADNEVD